MQIWLCLVIQTSGVQVLASKSSFVLAQPQCFIWADVCNKRKNKSAFSFELHCQAFLLPTKTKRGERERENGAVMEIIIILL